MRSGAGRLRRLSTALGGTLFPDSPKASTTLGRSFWAEDGPVLFGGAMAEGFGDSMIAPYSNYLVVLPRLIGEAATLVPLEGAPASWYMLFASFWLLLWRPRTDWGALAISFDQGEPEVRGNPAWDTALEEAAAACEAEGLPGVPVPTSPPGFGVYVPCDKIPESLGGQAPG